MWSSSVETNYLSFESLHAEIIQSHSWEKVSWHFYPRHFQTFDLWSVSAPDLRAVLSADSVPPSEVQRSLDGEAGAAGRLRFASFEIGCRGASKWGRAAWQCRIMQNWTKLHNQQSWLIMYWTTWQQLGTWFFWNFQTLCLSSGGWRLFEKMTRSGSGGGGCGKSQVGSSASTAHRALLPGHWHPKRRPRRRLKKT